MVAVTAARPSRPWPPVGRLVVGADGGDLVADEPDARPSLLRVEAEVCRRLGLDADAGDAEVLVLPAGALGRLADLLAARHAHLAREADAYGLFTRDGDLGGDAA